MQKLQYHTAFNNCAYNIGAEYGENTKKYRHNSNARELCNIAGRIKHIKRQFRT